MSEEQRSEAALRKLKAELEAEFLGRGGIHGLGLSLRDRAIRVYLGREIAPGEEAAVLEIRRRSHPFAVKVEREGRPAFTAGAE